jgi:plasmid stability protein
MAGMIQVRNVPEAIHRRLKARAALVGMSLSDYLLTEIRRLAERPTLDELRQRLAARAAAAPVPPAADAVRQEREHEREGR